jgi:hypothetical protein
MALKEVLHSTCGEQVLERGGGVGFHEDSALVVALHIHASSIAAAGLQPAGGCWESGECTSEGEFEGSRLRWGGGRGEEVEEGRVEGRHDLVIVGQSHHMRRRRRRWHNGLLPLQGELHRNRCFQLQCIKLMVSRQKNVLPAL